MLATGEVDDAQRIELPAARLIVQPPDGLAAAIGRGDFLESSAGLQCLEFNMLSALGGWESPLWAEAYLQVPVLARFLREENIEATHQLAVEHCPPQQSLDDIGEHRGLFSPEWKAEAARWRPQVGPPASAPWVPAAPLESRTSR